MTSPLAGVVKPRLLPLPRWLPLPSRLTYLYSKGVPAGSDAVTFQTVSRCVMHNAVTVVLATNAIRTLAVVGRAA